jgi:hypothetical protein
MLVKAKEMRATIPALMFDPQYYVFDLSTKSELTKFLIVEERNLDLAPFIDNRFEPISQGYFSVSTQELFALESQHNIERPRSCYIFHHAFVCSTLVARCLNQVESFFSLKEPWILRRLADYKRARGSQAGGKQWREMFVNYNALLAKNYRTGNVPVIKATNVANNLMTDLLNLMPGHPAVYLYSDLESFLVSNLKKPPETQQKMPDLARGFLKDEKFGALHPEFCDIDRLSFLQVCALIWVTNLHTLKINLEQHGNHQFRSMAMADFLGDMRGSLSKLSTHYGHQPSEADLDAMTAPEVTSTDAKHQENSYSTNQKSMESEQIVRSNKAEIAKALNWINPLVGDLGLMETLAGIRL